jgi:hypothetical protein
MFRAKPSWLLWLLWFAAYFVLEIPFFIVVYHRFTLADVRPALKDAAIGATLTWLIALYRWYRADSAS